MKAAIGHNAANHRVMDTAGFAEWVAIAEARRRLNERKAELKQRYVDAQRVWPAVEAAFRQQHRKGAGAVFTDEFLLTFGNLGPGEQLDALAVIDPDSPADLQAAYDAGFAVIGADPRATLASNPYHPVNQRNRYGRWKAGFQARQAKIAAEMAPADQGGDPEHLR